MSTSHVEIERKYEAPAEAHPDWSALKRLRPGTTAVDELDATYYDTAARDLAAASTVLRRRRGGPDEGWHVKYTLDGHRHEVHVPLLKDRASMPAAARDLVSALTLGRELEPIAHLATRRTRTAVLDEDGREVAEFADDVVRSVDHRTGQERTWREWEVELTDPELSEKRQEKIFKRVRKVLKEAGASKSTAVAKIARALGQDAVFDEKAGIASAPEPSESEQEEQQLTGGQRLVAELAGPVLADLRILDVAVRAGVEDSVHRMRIRLRTMRSILRALRGGLDPEFDETVSQGLKEAGEALGAARDLEVVGEVLMRAEQWAELTRKDRGQISQLLEEDREAALRGGYAVLDSERYRDVLAALESLVRGPQLRGWAEDLSAKKLGAHMMETLDERYRKRIEPARQAVEEAEPEEAVESLHEVRKAAKGLRYVIESLDEADLIRKKQREDAGEARAEAKSVQSEVGRLLDLRAAVQWLERAARVMRRRGLDRYGAGLLTGELRTALSWKLAEGFSSLTR